MLKTTNREQEGERSKYLEGGVSTITEGRYDLRGTGFDFVFNAATRECRGASGDLSQTDTSFRLFLFGFSAVILTFPVVYNRKVFAPTAGAAADTLASATADAIEEGAAAQPKQRVRLWHLDYFRIIAVWAVIMEHSGGEEYTRTNVA